LKYTLPQRRLVTAIALSCQLCSCLYETASVQETAYVRVVSSTCGAFGRGERFFCRAVLRCERLERQVVKGDGGMDGKFWGVGKVND